MCARRQRNWNGAGDSYDRLGDASGRMTTDISEKGLERLICAALTGSPCDTPRSDAKHKRPSSYGAGWICGDSQDYDREYYVDLAHLSAFLQATQPDVTDSLNLDQDR